MEVGILNSMATEECGSASSWIGTVAGEDCYKGVGLGESSPCA